VFETLSTLDSSDRANIVTVGGGARIFLKSEDRDGIEQNFERYSRCIVAVLDRRRRVFEAGLMRDARKSARHLFFLFAP